MRPEHTDEGNQRSWRGRALRALAVLVGLYLLVAYLIAPQIWQRFTGDHPDFGNNPHLTKTGDGHPGGPLNVALIGTEAQVKSIMAAAKWPEADPLGLRSDIKIATDTVLKRPDPDAPVSDLYLFGRPEDLAFELPVGDNPRQRNHVRFWRTERTARDGRPTWIGAASFDERVGVSHTTGQVTHHIAPDVDKERDELAQDLIATNVLTDHYLVKGFQKVLQGRNGGGDPWHTDGDLWVGIIGGK